MADEDQRFGVELRRRRLEQGLSLGELSRRLHYDKGYLSRVENGARRPSPDLVRRCDVALRADGALECLLPPPRLEQGATQIDALELRPDGRVLAMVRARESELPAIGSGRAPAPGSTTAASAVAALAADGATHASFESTLTLLRHRGRTTPPSLVLPSVVAELRALEQMLAAVPDRVRPRYLLLVAEFAEFAGWMAEDAGQLDSAADWTRRAAAYAHASGDVDLPAHAMVRLASAVMYKGDGRCTVELGRQAQTSTSVSPRIRGMAALREAQGHALLGRGAPCLRAVDRGRALLLAAQAAGSASALGLNSVPDPSGLVLGWCLYDLGRPAHAAEVLAAEIDRVPMGARRSRSRFGVRLALAQAACGDVDGAAATAATALTDAMVVDSTTIRVDVRRLARELDRWPRHTALRHVRPVVREVLRAAT